MWPHATAQTALETQSARRREVAAAGRTVELGLESSVPSDPRICLRGRPLPRFRVASLLHESSTFTTKAPKTRWPVRKERRYAAVLTVAVPGGAPVGMRYDARKPRSGWENLDKFGKTAPSWLDGTPNQRASVAPYWSTAIVGIQRPSFSASLGPPSVNCG